MPSTHRPGAGGRTGSVPRRVLAPLPASLGPVRTGIYGMSWDLMGVNGFLREQGPKRLTTSYGCACVIAGNRESWMPTSSVFSVFSNLYSTSGGNEKSSGRTSRRLLHGGTTQRQGCRTYHNDRHAFPQTCEKLVIGYVDHCRDMHDSRRLRSIRFAVDWRIPCRRWVP
jgi:hypothetical protein